MITLTRRTNAHPTANGNGNISVHDGFSENGTNKASGKKSMPTTASRRRRAASRRGSYASNAKTLTRNVVIILVVVVLVAVAVFSQRGGLGGRGVFSRPEGGDDAVRRRTTDATTDDEEESISSDSAKAPPSKKKKTAAVADGDEANSDSIKFADRHIRLFNEIAEDPDCLNPEFDVKSEDFDHAEVGRVFHKCRLVVLKNAYDKDFLTEYRKEFTKFMVGLKTGKISIDGTTTTGDSRFFASRGRGRWEIISPENLAYPKLVANDAIMSVLRDPRVLGREMELRSLQSTNAQHHADGQSWHYDQAFLFGEIGDNEEGVDATSGIAGHDLPPYAVTVGVPMMDMTRDLGPTEFCMGTSAVSGVPDYPKVKDPTLVEDGSLWHEWQSYEEDHCPPQMWRSPLLGFGDVVLFDYSIWHRGGWNDSPFMRSVLLLCYSKTWFDDINFNNVIRKKFHEEDDNAAQILWRTRLAKPRQMEEVGDEEEIVDVKDIGEFGGMDGTVYEFDFEANKVKQEFIASNKDVGGDGAILYLNDRRVGSLPPGKSKVVKGVIGDDMELRSGSGEVVGKWSVKFRGQIVFSKDS